MSSPPARAVLLLSFVAATGCGREGYGGVDHRVFYDLWTTIAAEQVPEGERIAAVRVNGTQADGRDATYTRVDRTLHGADSLTPGCTGELWRRGWLVATTPEQFGPDPGDPRFPEGRSAEVGEMRFVVEEALVVRYDCEDAADDVAQEDAPGVVHAEPEDAEAAPYSRPTDEAWWIGGPRPVLLRIARGDEDVDVRWPL